MPKARWQDSVIAAAPPDAVHVVEGNVYFPPHAVNHAYLQRSEHHSVCPWKGTADYFDVVVAGRVNQNAAWTYPQTKDAAKHIAGYIAFWRGVQIES
jgi:uncharacterized protein (DUF427 family)